MQVRSLGWEDPLDEGMAIHSSILAWRILRTRGAWWVTVHGVAKSQTWIKQLSTHMQPLVQFSSVQSLSCVRLCNPMDCSTSGFPLHHQLPPGACSNSCPLIGDATQPSHPLLCPSPSFPASGTFQINQFFTSGDQSIGVSASASVFPMNIQDWLPLGWAGWISLLSKGLSRVFSNTTVQKHQFFGAQLSLESNSYIQVWLQEKPYLWLDGPLLAK